MPEDAFSRGTASPTVHRRPAGRTGVGGPAAGRPIGRRGRRLLAVLAAAVATWLPGHAGSIGEARARVTLTGFATRGTQDDGKLSWDLRGERAVMVGMEAELENVNLVLHMNERGETVHLVTPKCSFNRVTQTARSDAPFTVTAAAFRAEGVGFDVLIPEQRLHVRRQAKLVIRHTAANVGDYLRLTPATRAAPALPSAGPK